MLYKYKWWVSARDLQWLILYCWGRYHNQLENILAFSKRRLEVGLRLRLHKLSWKRELFLRGFNQADEAKAGAQAGVSGSFEKGSCRIHGCGFGFRLARRLPQLLCTTVCSIFRVPDRTEVTARAAFDQPRFRKGPILKGHSSQIITIQTNHFKNRMKT